MKQTRIPSFTLIEVTVTIGVLVILLTMSTISYKSANSRSTIIMAAYQVAGDARLAQSYAASARQLLDDPTMNVWGINFIEKTDKYVIFVDKNANGYLDNPTDFIWKTVTLPHGISIKSINVKKGLGNPEPAGYISAVYFPPTPTTSIAFLKGTWEQEDSMVVTLEDDQNLSTKDITFNFFGLIDVTK